MILRKVVMDLHTVVVDRQFNRCVESDELVGIGLLKDAIHLVEEARVIFANADEREIETGFPRTIDLRTVEAIAA